MDHCRWVTVDLRFGLLNYEHQIPFPASQREVLEDVALSIRGHPTSDNARLLAPQDIRVYLDEIDATSAIVAELRALLDLQDEGRLRTQYGTALDKWIDMARKLGAAYGGDVNADVTRAQELLAVRPFSALLDQLGNGNAGNAGFLHVFNFLYSSIDLPPVSLRKVITRLNETAGREIISSQQPRIVTLSAGPCRLYGGPWQPHFVGGNVFLIAEFRYHDTTLDRLIELEKRVDDLENFVEEQLQAITEALGRDGDIQRAIVQARAATREARDAAADLVNETRSQNAQLTGLRASAQDLREAVEKL